MVLDVKIRSLKDVIALYIRKKLYEKKPAIIFVRAELERMKNSSAINRRQVEMMNEYRLRDKKQIKIDNNLFLHISKELDGITSDSVFGEEEVMKGGRVHKYSVVAKTSCWILEIKKDLFNTKFKERVKKMKEAKAVFIYNWMAKISPKLVYERVKEFLLNHFREIHICKDKEIIKEGEKSNKLIILKEGNFVLTKTIKTNNVFDSK